MMSASLRYLHIYLVYLLASACLVMAGCEPANTPLNAIGSASSHQRCGGAELDIPEYLFVDLEDGCYAVRQRSLGLCNTQSVRDFLNDNQGEGLVNPGASSEPGPLSTLYHAYLFEMFQFAQWSEQTGVPDSWPHYWHIEDNGRFTASDDELHVQVTFDINRGKLSFANVRVHKGPCDELSDEQKAQIQPQDAYATDSLVNVTQRYFGLVSGVIESIQPLLLRYCTE